MTRIRLILNILLGIISYALLAAAAATPPSPIGSPFTNATGVSWRPSQAGLCTCGNMTVTSDPTLEPADWRQCASLFSSWAAEKGAFSVSRVGYKTFLPLVAQRACTLSVEPADPGIGPYIIGSNDVEALFNSSLKGYSSGSLLAVKGTIECDLVAGGRAPLVWKISSPPKPAQ